jgi:hypothetical protein
MYNVRVCISYSVCSKAISERRGSKDSVFTHFVPSQQERTVRHHHVTVDKRRWHSSVFTHCVTVNKRRWRHLHHDGMRRRSGKRMLTLPAVTTVKVTVSENGYVVSTVMVTSTGPPSCGLPTGARTTLGPCIVAASPWSRVPNL